MTNAITSSITNSFTKWMRGPLAALVAAALLALPRIVHACAVCSAGRDDETNDAFLLMTGFMTVTPLIILGVTVSWFIRRTLAKEREEEAEREARAVREPGAPPTGARLEVVPGSAPRS